MQETTFDMRGGSRSSSYGFYKRMPETMSKSTTSGMNIEPRQTSDRAKSRGVSDTRATKMGHATTEIMRISRQSNYADKLFSMQRHKTGPQKASGLRPNKRIAEALAKSDAGMKGILAPKPVINISKNSSKPIVFGEVAVQESEGVDNYTFHLVKSSRRLPSSRSK